MLQAFEDVGIVAEIEDPVKDDVISEVQRLSGCTDDQRARVPGSPAPIGVVQHLAAKGPDSVYCSDGIFPTGVFSLPSRA